MKTWLIGLAYVYGISLAVIATLWASGVAHRVLRAVRQRLQPGRHRDLDELPGHLERVRGLADPIEEVTYWDMAGQLLDDERDPQLGDVAERIGWLR